MTKIKNFRIQLRAREIARLLKAKAKLQITPALEASIEHAISDSRRTLQPAAVYTTLTRSTAEKATPLPLADPAVAVSAMAVTLGPGLEDDIAGASGRQDALQSALLSALRDEALGQAVQFIMRLIEGQAKEEECELSAPCEAGEGVLLGSLSALLGAHRIGIPFDKDTPTLPPYARIVWTAWSPKVRAKAPARPAGRPDKAAVS
ncbi:MAG: hypothetical protein A2992_07720 [Elusimicrobia bacterium RIFCSPLOWO2_01_FULL_59_12]|nr:MAG: hypothetical protein A2992_07720 [Elusimicrobia bacterium RIFCSPLOWO2_01_FULL_59_12]